MLRFQAPPNIGQRNFWSGEIDPADVLHVRGSMRMIDEVLYFKERDSDRLYALDVARKELLWARPVPGPAMIIAYDDEQIYTMHSEINAYAYRSERRPVPFTPIANVGNLVLAGGISAVQDRQRLMIFTTKGIYSYDKSDGSLSGEFTGNDRASLGGRIVLLGDTLICVSNRAITAYAVNRVDAEGASANTGNSAGRANENVGEGPGEATNVELTRSGR